MFLWVIWWIMVYKAESIKKIEKLMTLFICLLLYSKAYYKCNVLQFGVLCIPNILNASISVIFYRRCRWNVKTLTRHGLYRWGRAASRPEQQTARARPRRRRWWSCMKTLVPSPPPWSAAWTPWCSRSATYPVWRANISLRSPPHFQREALRR